MASYLGRVSFIGQPDRDKTGAYLVTATCLGPVGIEVTGSNLKKNSVTKKREGHELAFPKTHPLITDE
jgi:hypothetical protein